MVRAFPLVSRRSIGDQLRRIQEGREPADSKPMPIIGPGVHELRVHRPSEFRVIYLARFGDAVYVLHAFEKKTRKTPHLAIELARIRYRRLAGKGD